MNQINIDAVRSALTSLSSYLESCPDTKWASGASQAEASIDTLAAAVDELERAQPVVAMFSGKTWTKRGDEMCVYTTTDDIAAIKRAVKGK